MKKMSASAIEAFRYKMLLLEMVNILVLTVMLGIQGAGYLGISLAILTLFVSFHSLWLSPMVAKYIRGRNARGQYKNSLQFFKGALLYVVSTGVIFCGGFVIFSNRLGSFFIRDIHIAICLILIGVMIFMFALSEVVSGYLQGMGIYVPVKVFYLVQQVVCFVGSIAGMKFLGEYGQKVAKLKHNEAVTSVYGAFGSLLGMLAGIITGFIVLVVFGLMLRGEFHTMRGRDSARYQESVFQGFQVTLSFGILQGIRYVMLISPLLLNYILYVRLCKKDGDSVSWIKTGGYFFGAAVPMMAVLIVAFLLLNHKNYRQLAGHWKNEAYAQFREKVFAIILSVLTLALPISVCISVLAEPILKSLIKSTAKEGITIIMYVAIGAILFIFELVAYKLMELWNETLYLYLTVVVSFGVQTAFAVLAFKTFDMGESGIALGMIVQAALFIVLFLAKFARRLKLSGYQLKKVVMVLIIALAGSLVMLLIYQLAGNKISAGIAIVVCVIPGLLLYLAAITVLRLVSDREAEQMPGGEVFLWLNGLLHR